MAVYSESRLLVKKNARVQPDLVHLGLLVGDQITGLEKRLAAENRRLI